MNIKTSTILVCLITLNIPQVFAIKNRNTESSSIVITPTIAANNDGYKIKFISNLSDLPNYDNTWYPDIYMNDGADLNITKSSKHDDYSFVNKKIIVNNGTIYRLVNYRKLDKYSNKFDNINYQLRLCRSSISKSNNIDCSLIIDSNSSGYNYNSTSLLLSSDDGDKIAGGFINSNSKNIAFEYIPFTNDIFLTPLYKHAKMNFSDNSSYNPTYYKSSAFFSNIEAIELSQKKIIVNNNVIYTNKFSCIVNSSNSEPIVLSGNYYAMLNQQIYSVNSDLKEGYSLKNQIGEKNGDFFNSPSSLSGLYNQSGIQISNDIIYVKGAVKPIRNNFSSLSIYYLPKKSESTQTWNNIKIEGASSDALSKSYFVFNQKKLYLMMPHTSGNNIDDYLYEISK